MYMLWENFCWDCGANRAIGVSLRGDYFAFVSFLVCIESLPPVTSELHAGLILVPNSRIHISIR